MDATHIAERVFINMAKVVLMGFIILMYPLLMALKAEPNKMMKDAIRM